MVNEKDKHIVIYGALEDFAALRGLLVAHHHCHESFRVQLVLRVVKRLLVVHVVALWIVKNLPLKWVLLSCRNIITGHEYYLVGVHTLLYQKLIGVMSIRLMTVIIVTARARYDHCPVVLGLGKGSALEQACC